MGALHQAIAILGLLLPFLGLLVNGDDHKMELASCDIYNGRWVYDNSYPLYHSSQCHFIEMPFDCQRNGRPDDVYLRYRWKPFACDLPRFSAVDFLERFRNKKIVFVGDSMSLNQWQSLTCMLHSQSPHTGLVKEREEGLSKFTFLDYNVSIIMERNALLVEIAKKSKGDVLNLGSIADDDAQRWRESDVLVFNSWHWWNHHGRKKPWDFIMDGDKLRKDMNRLVAYWKALRTWARWVENNIDTAKTKIFFQGISPTHTDASSWGNYNAKNCSEEKLPLPASFHQKKPAAEVILERVIGITSKRVHLLNITRLSQLRKDAHPSVYGTTGHYGMDCSHWCLPGLPDTWNELLYAELIRN
ncbi:hypothetical protein L6164_029364 [Bauhinia variegata]|uniref:Uncharacterized protein n=1 Tax=Bauhinia variegata TaxID=167791 RepID=A0ACB9L9D6_BAUVA|nr:hypothetical protein L6164_029364 [Bauhinia variegata]